MKTNVLVIGATGLIGKAIAKQMNEDAYSVSVLTRNAEKAKAIFRDDYIIHEGDVADISSLEKAMVGQDIVYINLPDRMVGDVMEKLLDCAKRSGVSRIGYTSGCTVREENAVHPMISAHLQAEQMIEASGIAYTIFKPTMILDTLPTYANNGKAFIIGPQPFRWSWIHTSDMARMVSKAFSLEETKNMKYTVHGPQMASFTEAIDLFNAKFNPGVKPAASKPWWLAGMINIFLGGKLSYPISIFRYFSTHNEEGDPLPAWELLGKPAMGVDEFISFHGAK